jgi:ferritin-like metal-binding protein YciE
MKTMDTLEEFVLEEMRDMYHAEGQLLKVIPRMARSATSRPLRQLLERHQDETQRHRERLELAFIILGQPARGTKCEAMAGLFKEGDELLLVGGDPAVKDAAIICLTQKIEHYEIASYGCLCTYAGLLGLSEIGQLLAESLEEGKDVDCTLAELAKHEINVAAMVAEGAD